MGENVEREVSMYLTRAGACPFEFWYRRLRDCRARQSILARIARLRLGNFGDCKGVGDGVRELRIAYGPGFRVYFGEDRGQLIVLLLAGDKASQARDIVKAKEYWNDYQTAKASRHI